MIEIIPAILAATFEELRDSLARIRGATKLVQIDVVDGLFAPNKTWPYAGKVQHQEWQRVSGEEEGLPFWSEFDFEADLMVREPAEAAAAWVRAGASCLIIHADAHGARDEALAAAFSREEGNPYPVSLGLALPCDADPGILAQFENLYDYVQVMGIAKPGFQGQSFDPRALTLVRALRERYPDLLIQVDGGVGGTDLRVLVSAGANRLVVGSRIFESFDPKREIEVLKKEANA